MLFDDLIASGRATVTDEWLTVADITTDTRVNTRPVYKPWVEAHIALFDLQKIGVPQVSARPDGTKIWLDGQNRGALLRAVGRSDDKIQCRVWRGLSVPQEAALFLALNDNRQVNTIYKFQAGVTAGELTAVEIHRAAGDLGWSIKDQTRDGCITAVVSLQKVHRLGRKEDGGGAALVHRTLSVVTHAWGYKAEAVKGEILYGLSQVLRRYGTQIDDAELSRRLAQYPAGPSGLIGDARGLKRYQQGTSIAVCVAETIVNTYNHRKRTAALPKWRNT